VPVAFSGRGIGVGPGINYADKQGFVYCSFRDISNGVWNWDVHRSSSGNFWYRSLFSRVGSVATTRAAQQTMWFGSFFHDIAGPIAIRMLDDGSTSTGDFYMVSSTWDGEGPRTVADTASVGVGVFFMGSLFAQKKSRMTAPGLGQTLISWGNEFGPEVSIVGADNSIIIDRKLGPDGVRAVVNGRRVW
jgi:hypothetical protein